MDTNGLILDLFSFYLELDANKRTHTQIIKFTLIPKARSEEIKRIYKRVLISKKSIDKTESTYDI